MQTTLCVPLEVRPESSSRLSALIDELRQTEDRGTDPDLPNFANVITGIPTLHFMSISVFTSADYDPTFILEANMDGPPGVFWGQIEAAFGDILREMLRCCKEPSDPDGPLYAAITAPGSQAPVAPYMEARTQWPSAFHHGNRGMSRDRILTEAALFDGIRAELDDPALNPIDVYSGLPAAQVHQQLRAALAPAFDWLNTPSPPRIPPSDRLRDLAKLMAFGIALLLVLSLPGVILASNLPTRTCLLMILITGGFLAFFIYWGRAALPGTQMPTQFRLWGFFSENLGMIVFIVGLAAALTTAVRMPISIIWTMLVNVFEGRTFSPQGFSGTRMFTDTLVGFFSLIVTLPLIIVWLRYLEKRDSSQDDPPLDADVLRDMARQEDWVAQNHMGSIVRIKPGVLRMILIRVGHLGLGLLLRYTHTDGYLGSMRTVHFAHWAFLNNHSRLIFLSNYDQSWGSYLDDFIEKANVGTTLAWGGGVGFPPTHFLIYGGSSNGRKFKAWALASRAVSRFWYSAYPDLTVNQIERNNRIADGLRKTVLSDEEARTWIADL